MYQLAPKLKLIVLLRNPVDRAWSGFRMTRHLSHARNKSAAALSPWYSPQVPAKTGFDNMLKVFVWLTCSKHHCKLGATLSYSAQHCDIVTACGRHVLQRLNDTTLRDVCTHSELYATLYRGMYADQLQYYFHVYVSYEGLALALSI